MKTETFFSIFYENRYPVKTRNIKIKIAQAKAKCIFVCIPDTEDTHASITTVIKNPGDPFPTEMLPYDQLEKDHVISTFLCHYKNGSVDTAQVAVHKNLLDR